MDNVHLSFTEAIQGIGKHESPENDDERTTITVPSYSKVEKDSVGVGCWYRDEKQE